jgi:hypothetical protein
MILTKIEVPESVPEHLKDPLSLLTGEVQDLHCARTLFWDLFIDAQDNIDLMHKTAPYFFRRFQAILYEHLILGIARLTDPPSTCRNRNLTFTDVFEEPLPEEIARLNSAAKDIRSIRNKIVGHLDFEVGLDTSKLPNQKFRRIKECTELMVKLVNLAWSRWGNGAHCPKFESFVSESMDITNCLKRSLAYGELVKAEIIPPSLRDYWNASDDMKRHLLENSEAPH